MTKTKVTKWLVARIKKSAKNADNEDIIALCNDWEKKRCALKAIKRARFTKNWGYDGIPNG